MFEIFKKYPDLITAISKKEDGTMKLTGDLLGDKKVIENRERFLRKFGINDKLTVKADLVHGNNVRIVSKREAGKVIEKTDGLVTAERNLFLTITVADCLPIFIYEPKKEIVGLVHGGWRNLAGNILTHTINRFKNDFKCKVENILAGIGPGISQCHYEVKEDLLREFELYLKEVLLEKNRKFFLDLKKIAEIQLMNLGLREENIEISSECTFCLQDKYFSYRRDKPNKIQTMMAIIGRK